MISWLHATKSVVPIIKSSPLHTQHVDKVMGQRSVEEVVPIMYAARGIKKDIMQQSVSVPIAKSKPRGFQIANHNSMMIQSLARNPDESDTSSVSSYFSANTSPISSKMHGLHIQTEDVSSDQSDGRCLSSEQMCAEQYVSRTPDIYVKKCMTRYVEKRLPRLQSEACKTQIFNSLSTNLDISGDADQTQAHTPSSTIPVHFSTPSSTNSGHFSGAMGNNETLSGKDDCSAVFPGDVGPAPVPEERALKSSIYNRKRHRQFDALEVHEEMIQIFHDVWTRHGNGCSEATYQRAVARRAYLDGLPIMMERELYADYGEGNLLAGRIDMEVASSCLYEMKIGPVKLRDCLQVKKYLRAYDHSKSDDIKIASLVYFTSSGVVVHDVRNLCGAQIKGVSVKRW